MADKKISDLTSGSTLGGTEELPIVQSASTVKTTINAIKTFLEGVFVKKGTLTANTIPKATASDTIGDSTISYDGSGNLMLGQSGKATTTGTTFPIYGGFGNSLETGYLGVSNDISLLGRILLKASGFTTITDDGSNRVIYSGLSGHTFNVGINVKALGVSSTGVVDIPQLTASQLIATDASKNLQSLPVATYPSLTELSYVKGLTSAIQTQFDGKLSSTKERLLFIGGFAAINPADGLTYYSGEVGASVATTTQSSYKFQFNENCTITRAVIMLRQVTNASNESVSFYLRASGSTDNTITTTLDMNSIGASANKVFVYSGLNISVTAGTDYENKMLCPTWATNPTTVVAVIKYYGY